MTKADVFIQLLHEVSGAPKSEVSSMFSDFLRAHPGPSGFDEELTDDEAQKLLTTLRQEKAGILNWLLEGAAEMRRQQGDA